MVLKDKVAASRGYNKKYYDRNKVKLTERKKERYKRDAVYRDRVRARARQQHAEAIRQKGGKVPRLSLTGEVVLVWKAGKAAKKLGITTYQLTDWERHGLLPAPTVIGCRAYYDHQLELIAMARDAVKKRHNIKKALEDVGGVIADRW